MLTTNDQKTVRLKFSKQGPLIYISHLDLNRAFYRAFNRAGLPMVYSEGFSPRPRYNFALPLSVGTSSVCEYVDIKLRGEISPEEAGRRMSAALPADIAILDAYIPESKFSEITHAEYSINISSRQISPDSRDLLSALLSSSCIVVQKRTKSGEKDTDISPFIKSCSFTCLDGVCEIVCLLCADSSNYLNPEYIVRYLDKEASLDLEKDPNSLVEICRNRVMCGDSEFK
ncbi:MAG: DUF2344 domain-containing protein [Clostridia bacterium]|nr:DUF2344 domain-containing protein [Clostridia bacterium]